MGVRGSCRRSGAAVIAMATGNTFRIDIKLSAAGQPLRCMTHWAEAGENDLPQVVQRILDESPYADGVQIMSAQKVVCGGLGHAL